jgi:hypothetical protein
MGTADGPVEQDHFHWDGHRLPEMALTTAGPAAIISDVHPEDPRDLALRRSGNLPRQGANARNDEELLL